MRRVDSTVLRAGSWPTRAGSSPPGGTTRLSGRLCIPSGVGHAPTRITNRRLDFVSRPLDACKVAHLTLNSRELTSRSCRLDRPCTVTQSTRRTTPECAGVSARGTSKGARAALSDDMRPCVALTMTWSAGATSAGDSRDHRSREQPGGRDEPHRLNIVIQSVCHIYHIPTVAQ